MNRSDLTWSLMLLEFYLGLHGMYGGLALINDPSGGALQLETGRLLGTLPFASFLIPGIVLLVVNGAFPLVVAFATLMRLPRLHFAHVAVGALLSGWMVVQVWLIGLRDSLQVLHLGLGLLILTLAAAHLPRHKEGEHLVHA